jgi:hypothetical protein
MSLVSICIKCLQRENQDVKLEVPQTIPVGTFRGKICQKLGICSPIRMIHNGKVMDDDGAILKSYTGQKDEAVIHVVIGKSTTKGKNPGTTSSGESSTSTSQDATASVGDISTGGIPSSNDAGPARTFAHQTFPFPQFSSGGPGPAMSTAPFTFGRGGGGGSTSTTYPGGTSFTTTFTPAGSNAGEEVPGNPSSRAAGGAVPGQNNPPSLTFSRVVGNANQQNETSFNTNLEQIMQHMRVIVNRFPPSIRRPTLTVLNNQNFNPQANASEALATCLYDLHQLNTALNSYLLQTSNALRDSSYIGVNVSTGERIERNADLITVSALLAEVSTHMRVASTLLQNFTTSTQRYANIATTAPFTVNPSASAATTTTVPSTGTTVPSTSTTAPSTTATMSGGPGFVPNNIFNNTKKKKDQSKDTKENAKK